MGSEKLDLSSLFTIGNNQSEIVSGKTLPQVDVSFIILQSLSDDAFSVNEINITVNNIKKTYHINLLGETTITLENLNYGLNTIKVSNKSGIGGNVRVGTWDVYGMKIYNNQEKIVMTELTQSETAGDDYYPNMDHLTDDDNESYWTYSYTNSVNNLLNILADIEDKQWVQFKISIPSPTTSASASGDPYISTLCGKKFKLPNSTKIYRMAETTYNNKQLIVNASVSQLTDPEINILKKFASKITNRRPVTNGYFFDKFFISYGNKYAIFNRNIELIETNITQNDTEFSIDFNNELKEFSCPLQLQGKCKQKETNIKIADKITINLLNIFNPQIINGIEFNYNGNNENIKGIFNTFYHPKNYVIKQIDNTKPIKLKTNLPEYKKQITDKFDLLI